MCVLGVAYVRRRKSIWAISLFCGEVEGEEMTAVSSGERGWGRVLGHIEVYEARWDFETPRELSYALLLYKEESN